MSLLRRTLGVFFGFWRKVIGGFTGGAGRTFTGEGDPCGPSGHDPDEPSE